MWTLGWRPPLSGTRLESVGSAASASSLRLASPAGPRAAPNCSATCRTTVTQLRVVQSCRGPRFRAASANRSERTASLNSPGTASAEFARKQICGNESILSLQWGARLEDNRKCEHGTTRQHLTIQTLPALLSRFQRTRAHTILRKYWLD